jgi:hypothetical protein
MGTRETAIARQRPCKQATIPEPSLGNELASNNGRTVGGGVFIAIHAFFYAVRSEARTTGVVSQLQLRDCSL